MLYGKTDMLIGEEAGGKIVLRFYNASGACKYCGELTPSRLEFIETGKTDQKFAVFSCERKACIRKAKGEIEKKIKQ